MKTFNLNSYVKVKLTEYGVKLLNETDFGRYEFTNNVENGIWKVQMWYLMNTFGEYMYNGQMKLPIETEIFIDEKWIGDLDEVNSL